MRIWGACLVLLLGCGSDGESRSGVDAPNADANLAPDAAIVVPNPLDCQTDQNCMDIGLLECVDIGSRKVCRGEFLPQDTSSGNTNDECPTPSCPTGTCFQQCDHLGTMGPINRCLADECTQDSDCNQSTNGICIPAGVLGQPAAVCSYGNCRVDGDCTNRAGGQCHPYASLCDPTVTFSCSYDDSPCRILQDCDVGSICVPAGANNTACEPVEPPAP